MPSYRFLKGAWLAPVAAAIALPVAAASGAPVHLSAHAAAAPPGSGHAFGGLTTQRSGGNTQHWPIEIEIAKGGKRVSRAVAAIELSCTPSGQTIDLPDRYGNISIRKDRRFSAAFGPDPTPDGSGGTFITSGSMHGRFNRGRTKASGNWSYTAIFKDASGTTTDTCRSGNVRWSVKR